MERAQPGSAISPEAISIARLASVLMAKSERSQSLFGSKAAAISELITMANECGSPGWDGADAVELDVIAVRQATTFLRALPDDIPMPEFAPEPDGCVSLDWIKSKHRVFSLSIGRSNRLAFAWLDGADKGHAVARFDGLNIPSRVLEGIRAILDNANAPLRVA